MEGFTNTDSLAYTAESKETMIFLGMVRPLKNEGLTESRLSLINYSRKKFFLVELKWIESAAHQKIIKISV